MNAVALKPLAFAVALFALPRAAWSQDGAAPNTLTQQEREHGWRLLFDGETTDGWRGYSKSSFPDQGWSAKNGTPHISGSEGDVSGSGGTS